MRTYGLAWFGVAVVLGCGSSKTSSTGTAGVGGGSGASAAATTSGHSSAGTGGLVSSSATSASSGGSGTGGLSSSAGVGASSASSTGTMATTTSATTTASSSTGGTTCTPGSVMCQGMVTVATCNAMGNGYALSTCPGGTTCQAGVCTCSPIGATACQGQNIVTCGANGMQTVTQTCPPLTVCRNGLCDDMRCSDETMQGIAVALNTIGWPRYRHDNRSSGWTDATVAAMPALKWKIFVGGTATLNSSGAGMADGPVVNQNNVIFVGAGDGDGVGGHFHAYDGNNMGAQIYDFPGVTGYGYTTPAVRSDGTAYYSTADGHAYAVAPNGTQQWSYPFGFQDDCSPIVTKDGYVIYGSDSGSLFALDPNGTLLWQSSISAGPGEVDSALAESCSGVIYAGGRNGWTTLNAMTGATVWQVPAMGGYGALMGSPNVAQDGSMYGIDSGGQGIAINATGTVIWQKTLGPGGASTDFARVGNQLFAVLNDGYLHAYDIATGNQQWQQNVNNSPELYRHAAPVVDGHMRLYFNSNDGNLYCFDTSGNQLFKLAASGLSTPGQNSFGTMAIGKDGTIYLPGNDGYLYAFQ